MADNQEVTLASSQESLPLSQETFQFLWDELSVKPTVNLNLDNTHFETAEPTSNNNISTEMIPLEAIGNTTIYIPATTVSSSNVNYVPSSLPASQNWPGQYNFTVSFNPQEKNTKGVTWTYSKIKDKLYVGKDVPCPINFSANTTLSDNVSVRAMALYGSPEHASEIVHRCLNHSMEELEKNVFEAEHLVRCESKMANYKVDQTTKRHSVVVPFELPAAGQHYSTYIYRFVCFGSCAGGPNRRPIMLIFSLEKDGQVVGRRRLDVKICACPGRDRKAEEQQLLPKEDAPLPTKRSSETDMVSLADTLEFTKYIKLPPAKKPKPSHERPYIIRLQPTRVVVGAPECRDPPFKFPLLADSQEQYDFLIQMKKFYEMCKAMNSLPPNIRTALALMRPKKSQDGDSS